MGSRRDNRSLAAGPTAVTTTLHSKHHHEKRNHELLKRLASDTSPTSYQMSHSTTTAAKTSSSSRGGVMSKSLTLDIGKGGILKEEAVLGKGRARKKVDAEKGLKSLQRQTSSSANRMSTSLNDKDSFGDNKMSRSRDLSPVKGPKGQVKPIRKRNSMTAGKPSASGDKKGGPVGENIKRADVFERLSRQDCNKGVTRSEHGPGNRIRDRSPAKTGRKSPQEKNAGSDKHLTSRKTAPGDASLKNGQSRKRDVSPMKRGEEGGNKRNGSNVSSSPQGTIGRRKVTRERILGSNHDLEAEDKDGSREKLEKDNVPESPDKDLKDLVVSDNVSKTLSASSREIIDDKEIAFPSHQERGGGLNATSRVKEGHNATQSTSEGTATTTVTSPSEKSLSSSLITSKKSNGDKILNGTKQRSSLSENHSTAAQRRPDKIREIDSVPAELSKADVMQKVRERVGDESTRNAKGDVDDDKDVCEAEKCDEDDFYKIKVQTRLVSYSNKSLVIKNTSKGGGAGVGGVDYAGGGGQQAGDSTEPESSHPPLPLPPHPHTLQTSSMAPPSVPHAADVEVEGAHALPTEANPEAHPEEEEEEGTSKSSPFSTRSRNMRLKLSQFVCKGKNFLTDVYSATQSKLEQYTRVESPSSSTGSAEDENTVHVLLPNEGDSGYYSIATAPGVMQSVPRNNTCDDGDVRVDREYPKNLSSADGEADTPDKGNTVMSNTNTEVQVRHADTVEMANEDEEDSLPAIPSPHVNFTLNEEWIKKNILCTCKCKRNVMKMGTELSKSSVSQTDENENVNNKIIDSEVIGKPKDELNNSSLAKPNCTETDSMSIKTDSISAETDGMSVKTDSISEEKGNKSVNTDEENLETEVSTDMTITKDEDDLCLCSCHDGDQDQQFQQLPKEVQEILDADHARMWWTITGNFGNILPIDWSKTYTRQKYLPVLNLNEAKAMSNTTEDTERNPDEDADAEEEEVAQDLDLHHLILNGLSAEPVKSAEEVIREIDDIMQEGSSSEDEGVEDTSSSAENANEPATHPLPPPLYAEKLKNMSIGELNESFMELEVVIRQYSETLINQLALRDELEYEKELKNSFISLLLQVQNKRRNFNVEKKKQKKVGPNGIDPKYLTTVIPYDVGHGPPQNETLQILIKILMAINEDSPTVPTLLTDYILKVLCPS